MRLSYFGASFCLVLALGCTVSTQGANGSDNDPVTGESTTTASSSGTPTSTSPTTTTTTPGTSSGTDAPSDQVPTDTDDDTSDQDPEDTATDTEATDSDADTDTDTDTDTDNDVPTGDEDSGRPPFGDDDFPWDRDDDDDDTEATDETTLDPGDDTDDQTDVTDTDDGTDTDSTEPEVPGPDCVPDYDCEPEAPNTGDFYADCVTRVNQFRACVCLTPLERATDAEMCLDEQSEYDSTRGAHAGFSDNICEPRGNAQNECPGWGSAEDVVDGCIQSMFNEGPPPTDECEGDCYQAHGHYINMTGTRYTRVACGLYQDGDETWSVQNFY